MRILLADDHRLVRDGLRAILEREGFDVVAEASTGREAIAEAQRTAPEIALMDISMPDSNGIDATRRLLSLVPATKVIGLSMNSDRRYVIAMFEAGAVGYLLKASASEELIQAVHAVARGHKYVSPAIAGIVLDNLAGQSQAPKPSARRTPSSFPAVKPLTTREREVLQLLAEGKSSKEIGACLSLGVATIETHRRQIMDKLGLRTIAELTKYAIREGLTSLE